MISHRTKRLGLSLAASGVLLGVVAAPALRGDEPSRIGRLFRLGGNTRSSDAPAIGKPSNGSKTDGLARPTGEGSTLSTSPPVFSTPTSGSGTPSSNRITPQPRQTKAASEADPLVTRVAIGRSDDGKRFCMFMEVFADGTILDSEGVHHLGIDHLRPIAQIIQSGELEKAPRYCGGPAADFIEQVHVVTYDRYRGRLRATSFAYSGNPQGCDPAVRQLNAALDALQTRLAGPPSTAPASAGTPPTAPLPSNAPPIGLTPDS